MALAEVEERHVEHVLRQQGWAVQRAAEVLGISGISRTALCERMRRYGLGRKTSQGDRRDG